MTNIVVVFPKLEDAKNLKNLLVRNGYDVAAVCTTGAQAVHCADGLVNGILLSAYKLPDMMYSELKEYLPPGFDMLLLASRNHLSECADVVTLPMPFAVRDLLNTMDMISQAVMRRKKKMRQQPVQRNNDERKIINEAKAVLMERNNLTEEEAHRYIQKCSMDSGNNMVETAQMLLTMADARI
ncbi:MAG: response regulator [Lachnospiraceae bacterium]|nr:response regulator [Lachnospiraceae bacterium]